MYLYKVFHESTNEIEKLHSIPKVKRVVSDLPIENMSKELQDEIGVNIFRVHFEGEVTHVKKRNQDSKQPSGKRGRGKAGV